MPKFSALVLSLGLSSDLDNEANATALSADRSSSKLIRIGNKVNISDQLSIWSSLGINEFTEAVSINCFSQ